MKSKLLDELIRTRTVIPAISDTIFKRLMMEHLDYLGYILENIMPLTQEEVMKGEFLMNELPSNHLFRAPFPAGSPLRESSGGIILLILKLIRVLTCHY